MILSGRSDLFRFQIPKVFFPQAISDRYRPYLKRFPLPTDKAADLINYSIQSVTVPNFNYSPVEQTKPGFANDGRKRGIVQKWRNSMEPEMLIDRSFSVTFKMLDGFVNYWIMNEIFFHYYDFANPNPFTCDIPIRILDSEGNVMYSVVFRNCLFTGIGEFTLDYTDNDASNKTFTCDFEFNEITTGFEVG